MTIFKAFYAGWIGRIGLLLLALSACFYGYASVIEPPPADKMKVAEGTVTQAGKTTTTKNSAITDITFSIQIQPASGSEMSFTLYSPDIVEDQVKRIIGRKVTVAYDTPATVYSLKEASGAVAVAFKRWSDAAEVWRGRGKMAMAFGVFLTTIGWPLGLWRLRRRARTEESVAA